MADTEKNEESKVMDVAKPGESKPETGSKPMVIGHKTMATDPSIKEEKSEEQPEKTDATQRKKIRLEPISSKDDPTKEEDSEEKVEVAKKEVTPSKSEEKGKSEVAQDNPVPPTEQEKAAEQQTEDDKKLEQEARLEEIIKSKEYNVPIKETSSRSIKTFFVSFIVVLVLGLLVGAALIDAEIIDVGIELPFDYL